MVVVETITNPTQDISASRFVTDETGNVRYVRDGSVNNTRFAYRTVAKSSAKRWSDADIVRDATIILATIFVEHGEWAGWVETLRSARWANMGAADQKRYRGAGKYEGNNLYEIALAKAKRSPKRYAIKRSA